TQGSRNGALNLDMEILAIGMERANAGKKALSYDSEQGGETLDELGYIPVLKKLVGGHLRFQVSSNGNVLRADGISEWLDRAVRTTNAVVMTPPGAIDIADPAGAAAPPPVRIIRQKGRTNSSVSISSGGGKVGSTLRSFFTQDLFKQMLEFPFIPPHPVRVGDMWSAGGETYISTRGRFHYEATGKFEGWQLHLGTNCARVNVEGNLSGGNAPAVAAKPGNKAKNLRVSMWINTELQFPAAMIWEKKTWAPDTTTRVTGTNRPVASASLKVVNQRVATTLLSAGPTEAPVTTSASTSDGALK
ncbi:MAG: hypothetical protein QOF48_379, partial [Verrucomicrobiota bacterium]